MNILKEDNEKDSKIRKLEEKLKAKKEECQRYKKQMVEMSVMERWQIGKYLHDNLAQQLISAKILTSLLKNKFAEQEATLTTKCDEIIDIVKKSIHEVRNLSHDIIPIDVEKEGVSQAFRYLKKQAETQYEVNCMLEPGEILQDIKRREVATNFYNIAQEAIKNAIVHGKAKNVKIVFIKEKEQLYLHIKDDGEGFNSEDEKKGRGITIMKHRAEEIEGRLKISNTKKDNNYTTCVTCSLPLKNIAGG